MYRCAAWVGNRETRETGLAADPMSRTALAAVVAIAVGDVRKDSACAESFEGFGYVWMPTGRTGG